MAEDAHQPIQSHSLQSKVTIDLQTLRKKQQLLISYYELQTQPQIIDLFKSWPNTLIQETLNKDTTLHKTNNAKFIGEICNQMFHGYGLLIYDEPKGRFYEGQFQNNCKHGDGVQYIGGDTYIGKFVNNKPEDSNGIYMWKNGDLFIGGFINGMKHGSGRWQSGEDFYVGTWKYNKPQGNGTIHTLQSEYVGDIKNGYKHGKGIQIFKNGDSYQGLYANGKPEGDGVYKWKNGATYKGQFKNGIRYGYGQWVFGTERYEGEYINDRRNGEGTYKWGNESYYKGQFVDDKRHGFGQMHWKQNAFYRGEWKEGVQSGEGEMWEDDRMVSRGIFEDGKLVKNSIPQPKLIRSRYEKQEVIPEVNELSTKKQRYMSSETKNQYMQKRKQLKSSSYYTNLSQIDEKDNSSKSKKKHGVTTSFSHNATNNRNNKSIKANKSIKKIKPHLQLQRKMIKETVYLPPTHKKSVGSYKGSGNSKTNKQRERSHSFKMNEETPKGIVQLSDTQLGPIKWKNFRHMNQARNSQDSYNLPHI